MYRPTKGTRNRRNGVLASRTGAFALSLMTVVAVLIASVPLVGAAPAGQDGAQGRPSATGLRQIEALLAEKSARSAALQKVDSSLVYAARQSSGGTAAAGVPELATGVVTNAAGKTVVTITARVNNALLERLRASGVEILEVAARYHTIRARIALTQIERIAGDRDIIAINKPIEVVKTGNQVAGVAQNTAAVAPTLTSLQGTGLDAATRQARVRAALGEYLAGAPAQTDRPGAQPQQRQNTSEGDVTHRANQARTNFGVDGSGVKIGVLSDGVETLTQLQASGDLPQNVTVLPGQAGTGNEGSAMLEIVYDLAPGAQLYFATGFESATSFADNIRALRAEGVDIIVDDLLYLAESPFQEGQADGIVSSTNGGVVSEAVRDVVADGAVFFSSASNSGNLNDDESGVWEGNFAAGGAVTIEGKGAGQFLDFDTSGATVTANTVTADGGSLGTLFWSDPLGDSDNDYDLFVLNAGGTVVAASTNVQSGTQDPFEAVAGEALVQGNQLVVVKLDTADDRFIHLSTNRGRVAIGTAGQTRGHAAIPAAIGMAATPAADFAPPPNPQGPFPNPFNASNKVELFSSDGPRQLFFNADGSPITPGNFLAGGGRVVPKPDLTAADGVSTASGDAFNPFFGTSAAAPHAAAIAGLVKSVSPATLTNTAIREILTSTAIDIEAPGFDRDSGAGIIDALNAIQATSVPLASFTATRVDTGVAVRWTTANEEDTFGFYVLRGTTSNPDDAERVTSQAIPATGRGQGGADYEWIDTAAEAETAYVYWLQVIDLDGNIELQGPARIGDVAQDNKVYLPLVSVSR